MIHIGSRIKEIFDLQPRGCTVVWLAQRLHCRRGNVYDIFSRSTIDTELLFRLSKILRHNFFADLASEFDNEETNPPPERSVR